jgi:hypothetical protein
MLIDDKGVGVRRWVEAVITPKTGEGGVCHANPL